MSAGALQARTLRTPPRSWWLLPVALAAVVTSAGTAPGEAPAARGDPAARLSRAGGAIEYWDVTTQLDSGYWLFARFMITNEVLGQQTGVGMGHVVLPDGRVMEFRYARRKGQWKLSPDRLRLDIASSTLDLHTPVRQFAIDSNTRGIKIHLHFAVSGPALWADDPADSKYGTDVLQLSVPVEGTLWVRGMRDPLPIRGTTMLTHTWMDQNEATLVQRRLEFFGRAQDLALYVSDLTPPAGRHRRWLVLERNGTVVHTSSEFELTLGKAIASTATSKYPVPGQLLVRDGNLVADIRPDRVLLRTNPFAGVPQPFRLLLQVTSQPQRIWAQSSVQLSWTAGKDAAAVAAQGQGILSLNFLNPLPLPN